MPKITTIIPTYRRPHMLKRAILSALNQRYDDIQVCIYDNASGDETASIVADLAQSDSRVIYHCHPQNIGMAANFNYGFAHITTPFFSLLCDDDLLLPEFYASAIRGFEAHPQAMFAGGTVLGLLEETQDIVDIPGLIHEGLLTPPTGLIECALGRHPLVTGVLYRKRVMDEVGLWEEDIITADIHFQMRATARYAYVISKQPYAVVITHQTNATHQVRDGSSFAALNTRQINLVKNELGLTPTQQTELIGLMNERSKRVLFKTGLAFLANADLVSARQTAQVLQVQFADRSHALVLSGAARVASAFDKASPLFAGLRVARRAIRGHKHQNQVRFLEVKQYIAALNQQCGL